MMGLEDIQKDVDDWVKPFNPPYWPIYEQMTHLTEETGEIARVINHMYGIKKKKPEEAQQELGGELVDAMFAIVCMANTHNINLQEQWDKMMKEKRYGRDSNRFDKKE